MQIFIITFVLMLVVVALMAIGYIFQQKKIKGSCGGLNNVDGLEGDCLLCSNKKCEKKKVAERSQSH